VVLVCEHSEEGALGLVLNRPGELAVADAAPELVDIAGYDAMIDAGGPVQPDALLVLAEFEDPSLAGICVVGDVGLVGDGSEIEDLVEGTRRVPSTTSSSARTGSSRPPASTTSSTPTPTSCGAACWRARAACSGLRRGYRSTPASTSRRGPRIS